MNIYHYINCSTVVTYSAKLGPVLISNNDVVLQKKGKC